MIFANDCFHMVVSSFLLKFWYRFTVAHFLKSLKWGFQDCWVGKSTCFCNPVDKRSVRIHVKVKKENHLYKVVLWPPHAWYNKYEHKHTMGAKRININWLIKPLSNLDIFLVLDLFCLWIFSLNVCMYVPSALRSEEGVDPLRLELSCGYWKLNPGFL